MAKIYQDDLDGRDVIAEGIFSTLIERGNYNDYAAAARAAYNGAEAFLAERAQRLKTDRNNDGTAHDRDGAFIDD